MLLLTNKIEKWAMEHHIGSTSSESSPVFHKYVPNTKLNEHFRSVSSLDSCKILTGCHIDFESYMFQLNHEEICHKGIKQCMPGSTSLIKSESMPDLNKSFYPGAGYPLPPSTNEEFKPVRTAFSFSQFCDPSFRETCSLWTFPKTLSPGSEESHTCKLCGINIFDHPFQHLMSEWEDYESIVSGNKLLDLPIPDSINDATFNTPESMLISSNSSVDKYNSCI